MQQRLFSRAGFRGLRLNELNRAERVSARIANEN